MICKIYSDSFHGINSSQFVNVAFRLLLRLSHKRTKIVTIRIVRTGRLIMVGIAPWRLVGFAFQIRAGPLGRHRAVEGCSSKCGQPSPFSGRIGPVFEDHTNPALWVY
jgi:hypothetical protein